jgi:hypothetical protein
MIESDLAMDFSLLPLSVVGCRAACGHRWKTIASDDRNVDRIQWQPASQGRKSLESRLLGYLLVAAS